MKQKKTKLKDFLENISVLQWILTFLLLGLACIGLMVYLMFTSLWPLPTLYFIWQLKDWHTPERGGRRTAFVRNWKMWKHVRDYFPMKLVKTAELNPNKNYILGCHPHGVMSMGAFTSFSTEACGFMDLFPGVRSCLCILGGIFKVPLYREYAMATGCYPVSRPSLEHLLSKSGKGNAVVIVIGGAAESLLSLPGVNTVYMKQRKGFVRVALEFGFGPAVHTYTYVMVTRRRPPPLGLCRGGDLCGIYSALSQDGKLVVEDIPLVVWGLCLGKVGGVISFLFGPVRGYHRMGPQCLLDPSCLSLQYLCCSSLCRGARVSLLYREYFSCLIRCPV
ncbi:diacylglycerol O-acyltransferase 2-like isoform X3 [Oncorhynchus clarkii lewisi]